MDLGIFDHLDRRDMPVHEFYESRLRLLEKYDAAGFYSYHLAEHHATPLGLAPVPGLFLGVRMRREKDAEFHASSVFRCAILERQACARQRLTPLCGRLRWRK